MPNSHFGPSLPHRTCTSTQREALALRADPCGLAQPRKNTCTPGQAFYKGCGAPSTDRPERGSLTSAHASSIESAAAAAPQTSVMQVVRDGIGSVHNAHNGLRDMGWQPLAHSAMVGATAGLCILGLQCGIHSVHHDWQEVAIQVNWAGHSVSPSVAVGLPRAVLPPVLAGAFVTLVNSVQQRSNAMLDELKVVGCRNQSLLQQASRLLTRSASAAVALGCGVSLGPEGPSVEIGKGVAQIGLEATGTKKSSWLASSAKLGLSAGLAAGFHAPIAGAAFAMESEKDDAEDAGAKICTLLQTVVASCVAASIASSGNMEQHLFSADVSDTDVASSMFVCLCLGTACGVASGLFRLLDNSMGDYAKNANNVAWLRGLSPVLGGLATGIVALSFPEVRYDGFNNFAAFLHPSHVCGEYLLRLLIAKAVATTVCKSSGLVGGVYAPSLFMGAVMGCLFFVMLDSVDIMLPLTSSELYPLVGMAAMLSGVCRVPLTSVLLLCELSTFDALPYALAGTLTSSYVAHLVGRSQMVAMQAGTEPRAEGPINYLASRVQEQLDFAVHQEPAVLGMLAVGAARMSTATVSMDDAECPSVGCQLRDGAKEASKDQLASCK